MIITNMEQLIKGDVSRISDKSEAIEIIKKLEAELLASKVSGIGLCATQIGIKKAAAIVRIPPGENNDEIKINLINPILLYGEDIVHFEEGCLSFPGLFAKTVRFNEIIVETMDDYEFYSNELNTLRQGINSYATFDIKNNRRAILLDGLEAIVCQHEMAHCLNLTMFDFEPRSIGRNEQCPCGSDKKNKKCHNYNIYNNNMKKLFLPNYNL